MTVNIGGKERPFSLDFPAFRVAERRHGVRIELRDFANIGLGDFAKYLWIGLLANDHDLSEDQVIKWMSGADLKQQKAWYNAVMEHIGTFGKLFAEETEDTEKKIGAGGPSIGTESNLSATGS